MYDGSVKVNVKKPQSVLTVWRAIIRLLKQSPTPESKQKRPVRQKAGKTNEPLSGLPDLKELVNVMKTAYDDEHSFNIALFASLRTCFDRQEVIDKCDDPNDYIVFKCGKIDGYAIAIAREANGEQKFDNDKGRRSKSLSNSDKNDTNSGQSAGSQLDHCCCLLKTEKRKEWRLANCLSAVKLKMSNSSSCAPFDTRTNVRNSLSLRDHHGALAHLMLHAMAWVLPSHAKIGQLGQEIPWAVVVGKQDRSADQPNSKKARKEDVENTTNRWVSGSIYVPAACGNHFKYAVTGFGIMQDDVKDNSVKEALSVYLATMLFGLKAAKAWVDLKKKTGTFPHPLPVSGKKVMIREMRLNELKLRGSATIGKFPNADEGHDWNVSQGEIFTGSLNMYDIYEKFKSTNMDDLLFFNKADKKVDVVVKVSSQAVHNYLTPQANAWKALGKIYAKIEKGSAESVVSKVLYAVQLMPRALVTIMADLSQDYEVLCPENMDVPLTDLWNGFHEVVQKVLLPLAARGLIHPDIRPGCDTTSNVLCHVEDDKGQKTVTMQVIDYESILSLNEWEFPQPHDGRYVERVSSKWNATTFLWWQCVAIAYAWKANLSQNEMKVTDWQSDLSKNPLIRGQFDFPNFDRHPQLSEERFNSSLQSMGRMFEATSKRAARK